MQSMIDDMGYIVTPVSDIYSQKITSNQVSCVGPVSSTNGYSLSAGTTRNGTSFWCRHSRTTSQHNGTTGLWHQRHRRRRCDMFDDRLNRQHENGRFVAVWRHIRSRRNFMRDRRHDMRTTVSDQYHVFRHVQLRHECHDLRRSQCGINYFHWTYQL